LIELILEKPGWVLAAAVAASLIALWSWIQTGQSKLLYLSAGVLAFGGILFAVGSYVETEQEFVRKFVFDTAASLEANQFDRVRASIYDRPSPAVLSAVAMLDSKNVHFDAARVKKIHSLEFSGPESARRAQIKMNVFVEGLIANHQLKVPAYVEVVLYKVDGQWKVQDFRYDHPMEGFKNSSSDFQID
jgi:hypothetical protein